MLLSLGLPLLLMCLKPKKTGSRLPLMTIALQYIIFHSFKVYLKPDPLMYCHTCSMLCTELYKGRKLLLYPYLKEFYNIQYNTIPLILQYHL